MAHEKFPIPPPVRQFATRFSEAGFSLYIVGGAVRDHLLGRAVKIMTSPPTRSRMR